MATQTNLVSLLLLLVHSLSLTAANPSAESNCDCHQTFISRGDFPGGFLFGAGSSAYQVFMFDKKKCLYT